MLPLVLDDTKLERMCSIQLVLDSVMRVATKIKGLKPSEWIKSRHSIVLLTSVLILKRHKKDKKVEGRSFLNSSIKSRWDLLGGIRITHTSMSSVSGQIFLTPAILKSFLK